MISDLHDHLLQHYDGMQNKTTAKVLGQSWTQPFVPDIHWPSFKIVLYFSKTFLCARTMTQYFN